MENPIEPKRPLILIIVAQTTPPLPQLEVEVRNVQEAIGDMEAYEVVTLESASTDSIFDKIQEIRDQVWIIHYAGHANGKGILLRGESQTEPTAEMSYIEGLARGFGLLNNLQLVFLNACATEKQVLHLSKAGIPTMVATQRPVHDDAAKDFATFFFKSLAKNQNIADAFEFAQGQVESKRGAERGITLVSPDEPAAAAAPDEWPWDLYGGRRERAWKISDFVAKDAEKAADLLEDLKKQMARSEIRAEMEQFRCEFSETGTQLSVLASYKNLHDLLHDIQVKCQRILWSIVANDNSDDIDWFEVEEAESFLQQQLEASQTEINNPAIPPGDTRWIQELEKAGETLLSACEETDLMKLRKSERLLNRAIEMRLPLMNTRLNEKARSLNLAPLLDALRSVLSIMVANESESDSSRDFATRLIAFERLSESLTNQVRLHDAWQDADTELRPIATDIQSGSSAELEMWWPDVKPKVEALCCDEKDESERWVRNIRRFSNGLDKAVEAGDFSNIQKQFQMFFRETTMRFYAVDNGLKKICSDLKKIGNKLSELLSENN